MVRLDQIFFILSSPMYLQLGVGGYSFAVNNNGHLLYHPDLRPMVSDLQIGQMNLAVWTNKVWQFGRQCILKFGCHYSINAIII